MDLEGEVMNQPCCAKVNAPGSFHLSPCANKAKVEVDGKLYCGTHNPDAVAKREEKLRARWAEEDRLAHVARKERIYNLAMGDMCREYEVTDAEELSFILAQHYGR
jgi:hypothetical protein